MDLLIATHNQGKIQEYREMLADLPFNIVGLGDIGLGAVDVDETGTTFEENAILKAVTYARASGRMAISDDSGICVDALDGAPGIYSARYGNMPDDATRRTHLLENMVGVPEAERTAHFVCVIAVHHPANGRTMVIEGTCDGRILPEERGEGGFGYDRLFLPEDYSESFGEMPVEQKNALSHRGRAVAKLPEVLQAILS